MNRNEEFKDILNEYMDILNCTGNDLAHETNLSTSIISRYRSGNKHPKSRDNQTGLIIEGLINIAKKKKIKDITEQEIKQRFDSILTDSINYEILRLNLNILIEELNINVADISRYLGYDPSYLSKIRSGIRKPAYINEFVNYIIKYINNNYNDYDSLEKIKHIINKDNIENLQYELKLWLCSNKEIKNENSSVDDFLKKLDEFNLDDYIKVIHFDELKPITIPIYHLKSKTYYGLEEMKKGELDFFKGTVLSKKKENIFMCSDMQMEDMTKDLNFLKSWMFGLAMILKKGLHINIIHNLNRPFNELMLGLEGWIPLYMTGQVTPYYFKNYNNNIYSHLLYVSGDYVLNGECIVGHHNKGKYHLTNNKKELDYYKDKTKFLLNKTTPLMEIYNENNIDKLKEFYKSDSQIENDRKRILSTLPVHTISNNLLDTILTNNNINDKKKKILKDYIQEYRKYIDKITQKGKLVDEIPFINEENFNNNYNTLRFIVKNNKYELKYNYNEYLEHLENTKNYNNSNYKVILNKKPIFTNIDIYINKGHNVVISKKKNPHIYFIIKHEKLINAIDNFIPLINENKR